MRALPTASCLLGPSAPRGQAALCPSPGPALLAAGDRGQVRAGAASGPSHSVSLPWAALLRLQVRLRGRPAQDPVPLRRRELPQVDELKAFLAASAGGLSLGRSDSAHHLDFADRKLFLFSFYDSLQTSFRELRVLGGSGDSGAGRWPREPLSWSGRSTRVQDGPALLFFSFFFFLSFCGWGCFVVLLVSLRRNFYWGKEPMAALPRGRPFL